MLVVVEVIVPPDVETLLVTYLNDAYPTISEVATVEAYAKVPRTRPALFTRVLRTGGPINFVIDRAQLTLEAWGNDPIAAARLANINRGLLHAIDRVSLSGSTWQFYTPQEFSGPANLPDPDSGQERYTQTFSVGVRAKPL